MDKLRTGVKEDLEANQKGQATQMVRMQAKKAYIEKLTFDVPSSIREQEMQSEIQSIVRRRRAQGASEEEVEKDKDQITAEANVSAIDNLRWYFAHKRIAEEEKVEVSKEDVLGVVAMQAQQIGRDPQEYIKELVEKKQIGYIQNQLLESKVIDLIVKHADITEIEPLKQESNPPA